MKRSLPSFSLKSLKPLIPVLLVGAALSAQELPSRLEIAGVAGVKVYNNIQVLGVTDQGLKFTHDAGLAVVSFEKLPREWRAKYAPNAPLNAQTMPTPTAPSSSPTVPSSTVVASSSAFDANCLVLIKTDGSRGSGFIAKAKDGHFVYTNAHVVCGSLSHNEFGGFSKKIISVKTASGRELPIPDELEMSETYDPSAPNGLEDVMRFPVVLREGETAYEIGSLDSSFAMDQSVVAYGNSLGQDVITSLPGKIIGLGTDRIEVSCGIVQGNSGGPVVLADTKQVIGISTYLSAAGVRDPWAQGTPSAEVRRFAVRPDKVQKWRKVQYASLMSWLTDLNTFDYDTRSLDAACFLEPARGGAGFSVPTVQKGNYIIKQIIVEGSGNPLGGTISNGIARVNQRLGAARSPLYMSTVVPVFSEFFSQVTTFSAAQMTSLKAADRAPYLKQYIPQLIKVRQEVHDAFIQEGLERFR